MSSPEVTDETTVNESHSVTVPAEIRDRMDIEPGDKLRWTLGEDDELRVRVVRQRYGALADLEPIDVGEQTDAVAETEALAYRVERCPTSSSIPTSSSVPDYAAISGTIRGTSSSARSMRGTSRGVA